MTRRWPNREGWDLLDVVPDGLVVVDRGGVIVHVNREAERMLGYARDELCGASLEVLIPPSARAEHAGHVRGFQGSRASRPMGHGRELDVLRKDGTALAVEIGLSPVEMDGDTVVVASLRDVRERRETVNALRRREEELAITLASIGDGVIATDVDGHVVRMNARAEELTGWPAEEALGRDVHEIFTAREGSGGLTGHTVLRSRDGAERPIAQRAAPILDAERRWRGVVRVFHDKSDEIARERAVRERDEMTRAILDAAPDGMVIVDARGIILTVNAQCERMFGRERAEMVGERIEMLMPERCRERHAQHLAGYFRDPGTRLMGPGLELAGIKKDGTEFALAVALSAVPTARGVVSIAALRDVTEQRRAATEMRESRDTLRALLDNAPDFVMMLDAGGVIRFLNRRTPRTPPDVIGRRWVDLLEGASKAAAHGALEKVMRTGQQGEIELAVDGAGGVRNYDVRLGPLGPKDAVRGAVIVASDVTDRKRAEAQLATSERMAAVGLLAAGVAHEINNPLSALVANVDLSLRRVRELAKKDATLDDIEEALRDARDASERVRHLVRDLKVFSRGDDSVSAIVDVPKLLDSTLRLAWNEIRHRARLVRSFGPMPLVYASEPRLGQVFLNLLLNAAQAIPDGHADDNEIRVVTRTDELGRAVVEIIDTGVGMSPDVRGRLFTPFFTTKERGAGTGLGLAICHRIVANLGGDIAVDSEPGHGTTFRVSLPAADERAHAPTPAPHVSPAPPAVAGATRRGLVLVVDDDDLVLHTVRRVLGAEHEVSITSQGAEALRWIREGRRYDVILCDLMMPSMTGMDVYDAISTIAPEMRERFVFATGGAFTARAAKFFETISNPKLHKPFELDQLRRLVGELVLSRPAP